MLIALLSATVALSGGQAVSVISAAPAPAEAARAGEPNERRVCRFERATGSNLQQRVCRTVPRQGFQDEQTRDFLRATQRVRFPDEGAASTPTGPNS
ncbi:hypothetical protein [Brevundimonas sp.]|jgi:hypothetical protein|uniref:hypothetical protein n=1 Tax=Brevundimonas sp. TaxID=1871086 RepID=UPI002ED83924